jgi:uncharacterized protein (TIGR00106 family)
MIKGMSFNKGILFIGKSNIACTHEVNGRSKTWLKPLNIFSLAYAGKILYFSMPLWFHFFFLTWLLLIIIPYTASIAGWDGWTGLPAFTLIYFLLGTHFWFPRELKKYHGAEHKVFSYKGVVSTRNMDKIRAADITNRYCSTNVVLLYFLMVPILFAGISAAGVPWLRALEAASVLSLILLPAAAYWMNRRGGTKLHTQILNLSYQLQKYVTTGEPEDRHLKTAVRAYRRLALKEFPSRVRMPRSTHVNKREESKMAIADITVIPIGTNTTSVSGAVAEIHQMLKKTDKPIKFELTPMSTIIEGDIDVLFEIIREIHELPFKSGHQRTATNIRIDDRRDSAGSSMEGKLRSVREKINEGENPDNS